MTRSLATLGVIGLALAVTTPALAEESTATATAAPAPKPTTSTHTAPAAAPTPAPKPTVDAVAAPPPPPPVATVTPLATLPVHEPTKLQLAPEPASSSWGYKIAFGLVVVAGGVIAWKKKKGGSLGFTRDRTKADGELRITARANVGMRAEIAVVEVSGMRILVGITAQSIQNLAVLDEEHEAAAQDEAPVETPEPMQTRARLLFGDAPVTPREPIRQVAARYADVDATPTVAPPKRTARRPRLAPAPAPIDDDARPIEGQARGITLSLKK